MIGEGLALATLRRLDPERAHGLALAALRWRPGSGPVVSPRLGTRVGRLALPNPVGIAAGFDKDAVALGGIARTGAGFAEVGALTPRPQEGNPPPRLWRLTDDRAAINRFGFNNRGMEDAVPRLAARPPGVVGVNLGANKDSADRAGDFAAVLARIGPYVDYATINVSSPNTERLRDLQGRDALAALAARVIEARDALPRPIPVWLKIAPDLTDAELADIAGVAEAQGLDAIVATNTTLARDGLRSTHRDRPGGLSGAPLFDRSTRVLARLSTLTRLPLVGVGGIGSAEDAYAKIRAGASAVQLYTALAYQGPGLLDRIARRLDALLARDGFASVADAVGTDRDRWL